MKNGWQIKTLGEVCEVLNGFAFDSKSFNTHGQGLPLIRIRDVKRGYSETYYSGEYSEAYIVNRGDYLIGMDGEFNIGEWKSGEALLNQRVCKISCDERVLLSKYLFYLIPSHLKDIENKTAFATVKHLSSKQIKALVIPIPPLEEQKRIVAILDSKFAAIDAIQNNATKSMEQAEAMWQATLKHELCQRNGWSIKTLGEVSTCARGLTYSKKDEALHSHNVVLRSNNVDLQTHCLDLSELKHLNEGLEIPADKKVKKGSLLICLSNGSKSHLGKVAIVDKDYGYAFGGFMGLLSPSEEILTKYLFYNMISLEYKSYIKSLSDGSNINNLKLKDLSAFPISLPSLEEQKRIVESLDRASASIAELKANCTQIISHCTALKQALLRQAFNGEL